MSIYSLELGGVRFGHVEFKMPVKQPGRQRKFKARSSLEMHVRSHQHVES